MSLRWGSSVGSAPPSQDVGPFAPPRRSLLASVTTPEARSAVERAARTGVVVRYCAYQDDLPRAAAVEEISMIVWEVGPDGHYRIPAVASALRTRGRPVSLLARIDLP